ncbi:MAG TPA: IS4 family transposase [Nannocystis exedens]|nr:IS4 family transposase [Nannocystis exedens]
MPQTESIFDILESDVPVAFERFGKLLDARWIDTALKETGTATVRRRKLPAQLVVWLVIGMALFRDRSIKEVVDHVGLVLPSQKGKRPAAGKTVAPSAIPQARYRVGATAIKSIFERTAETWAGAAADAHRWRGLAVFGVDGSTFRVPDTDENREAFGLPGSGRGQAGYPQVRLVALMALRSHLISAAAFGPCRGKKNGESSLAQQLWPQLPDDSLVIVDKGFIDYGLFYRLSHDEDGSPSGKHWLVRAKKNGSWKTLKAFGPGDELVELNIRSHARKDPSLPTKMVARAIRYQVKGYRPQTLLTSLVDPEQYPPTEVAALYHERWEIELGYDEVKTHMLERQEALRSKKAEGVEQELWGILLAYNLVRKEMLDVAEAARVSPLRVSFRHSLMLIRNFCLAEAWCCAPGNIPKRLASLHETMATLLILPERRPERRYKRHVKIKMSKFKRNPGKPLANGAK